MSNETPEFGTKFVQDYSTLLCAVWASEQEMSKLLADPTAYAKSRGLPVAPGARVEVDRTVTGRPHKNDIVDAWTRTPGVHTLCVPQTAPIDLAELTDAELDTVAAGDIVIVIIL
jgi:hypothetical protein